MDSFYLKSEVRQILIDMLNWLDDYYPMGLPEEVVDTFLEEYDK